LQAAGSCLYLARHLKWCAVCESHTAGGNLASSTDSPASITVYQRKKWLQGSELHRQSRAYETLRRLSLPALGKWGRWSVTLRLQCFTGAPAPGLVAAATMVALEGFPPTWSYRPLVPKTSAYCNSAIGPLTMACRLGAAPSGAGFGDLHARAGARHICDCLRIAPGSPDWQSGTLALEIQSLKPKRTNTHGLLRPQDFTGGAFRNFRNPLSFVVI
jgi:hypothetical protein